MPAITSVIGREILDSRGNPTVEVTVGLEDGSAASAGVPSGVSTGALEARELRDGDTRRYRGLGVLSAVASVNTELRSLVVGLDALDQKNLDEKMRGLDGTPNKSRLGANALLGVSLSVCRAAALFQGLPLFEWIANLMGKKEGRKEEKFPIPMFNVINGGKHSNSGLSVQEFKIVPAGIPSYPEQLRAGSEIFHALGKILDSADFSTSVGDEGGFAPRVESHKRQMEIIREAIEQAGYQLGRDIFLDLDVAADSFFDREKNQYLLKPENVSLSRESLINLYREWAEEFHIVSLEDGLHEADWEGWSIMKTKLSKKEASWKKPIMLVGDDLLVTNVARVKTAIEKDACNAVLIKPNQIGTVSETLDCMNLAATHGLARVVSHRSGETTDDFIADLAVGAGAEFIKAGSLSRGERVAKYNRLLALYDILHPVTTPA